MSQNLFRATKRKPVAGPLLFTELPEDKKPVKGTRVAKDFYPTGQPEAILALLHADGERIRKCSNVWEPACGKGDMVRYIRAFGMPCCASDIEDRGCPDSWVADYYTCLKSRGDAIITNPPYCEINARDGHGRWLRHTLEMPGWSYLALLLSWDWPAARANGLGELLDERTFTTAYLMRWKLDFTGEGSPPQRNAWFIWDRRDPRSWSDPARKAPDFKRLDRIDPRQSDLFPGGVQ